jgi:putative endonuclease
MTTARQALGELGEAVAERWLTRRGWRLIGRRFRNGHRDIDLIVEGEDTVVFVEVKARRIARATGEPEGLYDPTIAVDWRKQRELSRSAHVWIDRFGKPGRSYRFDVVGVLINGSDVRVRHLENAFELARSL